MTRRARTACAMSPRLSSLACCRFVNYDGQRSSPCQRGHRAAVLPTASARRGPPVPRPLGPTCAALPHLVFSERSGGLSPATMRLWFHRLYTALYDVQEPAGHAPTVCPSRYASRKLEVKRDGTLSHGSNYMALSPDRYSVFKLCGFCSYGVRVAVHGVLRWLPSGLRVSLGLQA
jgi:hypothetical protein